MASLAEEQPLYPRQLEERFGVSEATWRAWTRRAENPLPHVRCGSSGRPHRKVYAPVAAAMLRFEMGVAPYAEVEQAAGRCAQGARS